MWKFDFHAQQMYILCWITLFIHVQFCRSIHLLSMLLSVHRMEEIIVACSLSGISILKIHKELSSFKISSIEMRFYHCSDLLNRFNTETTILPIVRPVSNDRVMRMAYFIMIKTKIFTCLTWMHGLLWTISVGRE